jgi:hypothetical protein
MRVLVPGSDIQETRKNIKYWMRFWVPGGISQLFIKTEATYCLHNQHNNRARLWISIFRGQISLCISFILQHTKIYFFTGTDKPLVLHEAKAHRISRQPRHKRGKVISFMHRPPILLHAQYWNTHDENSLWSLCPDDPSMAIIFCSWSHVAHLSKLGLGTVHF